MRSTSGTDCVSCQPCIFATACLIGPCTLVGLAMPGLCSRRTADAAQMPDQTTSAGKLCVSRAVLQADIQLSVAAAACDMFILCSPRQLSCPIRCAVPCSCAVWLASCAGCQNTKLTPLLDGAPNFRQVEGLPVYGVAIPTVRGLRNVMDVLGAAQGALKCSLARISYSSRCPTC